MGLVPVDRSILPAYTLYEAESMFPRILPPLLVVLILANPVFCQMLGWGKGAPSGNCEECGALCMCEGDADCRERERCCGPCENQEAPTKPCHCADDSYCQCLCAGAVLEEAASLDEAQDGLCIDRITAVLTLARPTLCSFPDRFGERFPRGKANLGRIVRCLCMSFLC
jgi:hypothetical protein